MACHTDDIRNGWTYITYYKIKKQYILLVSTKRKNSGESVMAYVRMCPFDVHGVKLDDEERRVLL